MSVESWHDTTHKEMLQRCLIICLHDNNKTMMVIFINCIQLGNVYLIDVFINQVFILLLVTAQEHL